MIPKRHSEFLLGALMELLSNITKYANGTIVTVTFSFDTNHIKLAVSDNGNAFSMLSDFEKQVKLNEGYGLRKIERHVRKSGGDYHLRCYGSFEVELSIPLERDNY
jgi:signal transduction histidine kinase